MHAGKKRKCAFKGCSDLQQGKVVHLCIKECFGKVHNINNNNNICSTEGLSSNTQAPPPPPPHTHTHTHNEACMETISISI